MKFDFDDSSFTETAKACLSFNPSLKLRFGEDVEALKTHMRSVAMSTNCKAYTATSGFIIFFVNGNDTTHVYAAVHSSIYNYCMGIK